MKINLNTVIPLIESAIETNLSQFREEPDSDGEVHDQWDEQNDAIEELQEKLEEFIEAFDACNSLRPSLGRTNINIRK